MDPCVLASSVPDDLDAKTPECVKTFIKSLHFYPPYPPSIPGGGEKLYFRKSWEKWKPGPGFGGFPHLPILWVGWTGGGRGPRGRERRLVVAGGSKNDVFRNFGPHPPTHKWKVAGMQFSYIIIDNIDEGVGGLVGVGVKKLGENVGCRTPPLS